MATNFLDIIGKIDDLQAVLHEYEEELSQAERKKRYGKHKAIRTID